MHVSQCMYEMSVFVTVSKVFTQGFYFNTEAGHFVHLLCSLAIAWLELVREMSCCFWYIFSALVTPAPDLGRWSVLGTAGLVRDITAGHWGVSRPGALVGDTSCWCGESAMTSAGLSDASVLDSSLLDVGRGMDRKLRALTWGLLLRWRWLKAVSL